MKTLTKEEREGAPIYVVQEHWATKHHFDLRLQAVVDGKKVLLSWAVPKGISDELKVKRLAIRTPNHQMSWAKFKGEIPEGEYGAGKVDIWDKGVYIPITITKVRLDIEIHGKKIKGVYRLSKMDESKWIIERLK